MGSSEITGCERDKASYWWPGCLVIDLADN